MMTLETVFPTELGYMGLAVDHGKVIGLTFGHSGARAAGIALRNLAASRTPDLALAGRVAATERDHALAEDLTERLTRFAEGEPVDFSDVPLETSHLSEFQLCVVETCRQIPWGETRSYGELAAEVRHPGAARAVGTVMSSNRYPLVVPCHRVLGSGGRLGGYSAPQGLAMKRRLLDVEANSLLMTK